MQEVVDESIADRRLRLRLAAWFAALALGLAAVALWGAVTQSVIDRRRELAVRLALGASRGAAVRLMVRGAVVLITAGIGHGTVASALVSRLLRHLLHGIGPTDPPAFVVGITVTALISLAACYLPARRAARVSPTELFREG
jgi:putative ABC transport system permease protein